MRASIEKFCLSKVTVEICAPQKRHKDAVQYSVTGTQTLQLILSPHTHIASLAHSQANFVCKGFQSQSQQAGLRTPRTATISINLSAKPTFYTVNSAHRWKIYLF